MEIVDVTAAVVVKNNNQNNVYKIIRRRSSLLIILSSLLFVASFYGLVIGLFLFLLPLYWLFLEKRLSFFYGFIWGIIFFSFHSFDFFYVVYQEGYGSFRLVYPILLVVYCALFPGLWFLSVTFLQKNSIKYQHLIWILVTFLYFSWIDRGLFFPFGRFEGNPLCFVLLPLFYKPILAQIIGLVGKWVTVFLLIFISLIFAELYFKKRWKSLGTCLVGLILCQLLSNHTAKIPAWFHNIVVLDMNRSLTAEDRFEKTLQAFSKVEGQVRKLFILPESSMPSCKAIESNVINLLQQNLLQGSMCIFGTHIKQQEEFYNSFLFIDSSRIIQTYEKTHLIPFFEYNPYAFFKNEFLFNFFLHKRKPFTNSLKTAMPIHYNEIGPFLPVICSELFWDTQRKKYPKVPLICIANDSYFKSTGYQQYMRLGAQLVALSEQRAIVYVSWSGAYFISDQAYFKKIEKIFQ